MYLRHCSLSHLWPGAWPSVRDLSAGTCRLERTAKIPGFQALLQGRVAAQEDPCPTGSVPLYLCSGRSDEAEVGHVQSGEVVGLETVELPLARVVREGLRNRLGTGSKSKNIPTVPECINSNKASEVTTSP